MDTDSEMLKKMSSLDVPVTADRPSEIHRGLEIIEKHLAVQRELISFLSEKLGPVLLHSRPEAGSGEVEPSGVESDLGHSLEDIAQRIDLNNYSIQGIIERVAL